MPEEVKAGGKFIIETIIRSKDGHVKSHTIEGLQEEDKAAAEKEG